MKEGFQKCPICNGTGRMWKKAHPDIQLHAYETDCDICNGKRIISVVTGKPPQDEKSAT